MAQEVPETKKIQAKPTTAGSGPKTTPLTPAPLTAPKTTTTTTTTKTVATKKSGSGLWVWLGFIIFVAIAGYVGWHFYSANQTSTAAGAPTGSGSKRKGGGDIIRVVTAKATLGNIGVYLNGLGSVTPLNTVTVKSRVDGQLMKVLFQEGQMVKEGDLLIQLDDRPYQAQVAQYKAQKEHDQALLDNAKIDLQRYQTLWAQDSIPQQTLATQEALVKQDQGTVDSDQALIDTAQLNVTYCNITAPISGRVGLRLVDQGNQVHASDTNGLLVITQVQPIAVLFTIPEDSIQPVLDKLSTSQSLAVDAYDRGMNQKLASGTLLTTDNQIDQTTGTLKLKAIFPNTKNELFPNQFVNVRLLVETKKDVTLVPVAAIQHGTQGTFVYVVQPLEAAPADSTTPPPDATPVTPGAAPKSKPTNSVKLQIVTVGTTEGDQSEIQTGLSPGDVVVTDGVDKLQNGSKVIVDTGDGSGKHGKKKSADAAPGADATTGAAGSGS
jgi:multidrug efflux system membrane fusion protein